MRANHAYAGNAFWLQKGGEKGEKDGRDRRRARGRAPLRFSACAQSSALGAVRKGFQNGGVVSSCQMMKALLFAVINLALLADLVAELAPNVRGVATRAPAGMKIDGDLSEWNAAFCTPVDYFNPDRRNRPAQFFYMWDNEAFYAALRTLDEKPANHAPDNRLWEGDGVEWYFDTRPEPSTTWSPGAVHCYWVAYTGTEIKPRFLVRSGYYPAPIRAQEKEFPNKGIEVAAKETATGVEMEFKMPWANFPEFKARTGATVRLDAELCYGDGSKSPRSFAPRATLFMEAHCQSRTRRVSRPSSSWKNSRRRISRRAPVCCFRSVLMWRGTRAASRRLPE